MWTAVSHFPSVNILQLTLLVGSTLLARLGLCCFQIRQPWLVGSALLARLVGSALLARLVWSALLARLGLCCFQQ